jgi:hypothetical protein
MLAAALAAAFSGCANIPLVAQEVKLTHAQAEVLAQDGWQMHEAVVKDGSQAFVLHMPVTPPKAIKNSPFSLSMSRPMSVNDIAQVLSRSGIPVVIDGLVSGGARPGAAVAGQAGTPQAAAPQASAAGGSVFIPKYTGTVGSFLAAVSKSTDTWFTWHDGFLRASATEEVAVSLPQDPALITAIKASMGELAAENVTTSLEAGLLVFRVAPSGVPKIRAYLDRVIANAALITLQVALVSVTSDQDAAQGLDWSSLQLAFGGKFGQASNILNALGGSTEATDDASSSTNTDPGKGGYLQGSTLRLAGNLGDFSLIGFVDFMNNYGNARTVQNAMVTTLSANEVELISVTDVPYVSNVSVGSTGGTEGGLIGSSQTSTAKDGMTIKLKPYYDRASNMVTLPLSVSVQAVLGFKDLSAGNQLGSITQPTTGTRSIVDTLRMRPGETMVIGGITFDNVSRSDGLPLFMQPVAGKGLEHQTLKVSRNSLYIIIRPTVRLTPPILEQEGFEIVREAAPIEKALPSQAKKPAVAVRPAVAVKPIAAPQPVSAKRPVPPPVPQAQAPLSGATELEDLTTESLSELARLPASAAAATAVTTSSGPSGSARPTRVSARPDPAQAKFAEVPVSPEAGAIGFAEVLND